MWTTIKPRMTFKSYEAYFFSFYLFFLLYAHFVFRDIYYIFAKIKLDMETWKDIKGYEGIYQVSNEGNVRSCEREIEYLVKGFSLVFYLKLG